MRKFSAVLVALPLGELPPQVTERAHAVRPVTKVLDAIRNFPAMPKPPPFGEGGFAKQRRRGFSPLAPSSASPQRRAFAESGAANAASGSDPSRENGIAERPQALRYPENKNLIPPFMRKVQRRRPPPVAETGRSCWGSGQQDASAAQGTMRMLGAATR